MLFETIHRAGREADAIMTEALKPHGLTCRQFTLLHTIAQIEAPSQTALVEATGIDRSTLSKMIELMLSRRLIARARRKRDQRAYRVSLTPTGERILTDCEMVAAEADAKVVRRLSLAQRPVLIDALTAITRPLPASSRAAA